MASPARRYFMAFTTSSVDGTAFARNSKLMSAAVALAMVGRTWSEVRYAGPPILPVGTLGRGNTD